MLKLNTIILCKSIKLYSNINYLLRKKIFSILHLINGNLANRSYSNPSRRSRSPSSHSKRYRRPFSNRHKNSTLPNRSLHYRSRLYYYIFLCLFHHLFRRRPGVALVQRVSNLRLSLTLFFPLSLLLTSIWLTSFIGLTFAFLTSSKRINVYSPSFAGILLGIPTRSPPNGNNGRCSRSPFSFSSLKQLKLYNIP